MMKTLLRNSFTAFYGISNSNVQNITLNTSHIYFEIEDDADRELQLHTTVNAGMAKFSNPQRLLITVINYDKFLTALPHNFQQGKQRCDLIGYSANNKCFLLGELKDRNPRPKVRTKAIAQLIESLKLIIAVDDICTYINSFTIKQCCYFNKQTNSPQSITATNAFNRVNQLTQNGFKMTNPNIESLGFEYYEFYGFQKYIFL